MNYHGPNRLSNYHSIKMHPRIDNWLQIIKCRGINIKIHHTNFSGAKLHFPDTQYQHTELGLATQDIPENEKQIKWKL